MLMFMYVSILNCIFYFHWLCRCQMYILSCQCLCMYQFLNRIFCFHLLCRCQMYIFYVCINFNTYCVFIGCVDIKCISYGISIYACINFTSYILFSMVVQMSNVYFIILVFMHVSILNCIFYFIGCVDVYLMTSQCMCVCIFNSGNVSAI